ncbi:helix-turn-helix domain-containing protein [Luteimonas sp. Y-2-2-4F]|nr:helix-turn-helix domain-containing protein [Luteimonas sp. Y-2-2-4F]
MLSIGDRIRQVRAFEKLSQTDLAALVGVSRSAVALWERVGGNHPSVEHLARIAVVTKVYFEWLATGRGEIRPVEGGALTMAVHGRDFAQDELEDRVLASLRRLSRRHKLMACKVVDAMVKA